MFNERRVVFFDETGIVGVIGNGDWCWQKKAKKAHL